MFCKKCGKENSDDSVFCRNCGELLTEEPFNVDSDSQSNSNTIKSNASEEDMLKAFICGVNNNETRYPYYKDQALRLFQNGKSVFRFSWNWSAFFCGWWHLLYRKNYVAAALVFILGSLTSIFAAPVWIFITGAFNNYFIFKRYEDLRHTALTSFPNQPTQQLDYLKQKGGVNKTIVWIFLLLVFLPILILMSVLIFTSICGVTAGLLGEFN